MNLGSLAEDDLPSKANYKVSDIKRRIDDAEFARNSLPSILILSPTSSVPDTSTIGVWANETGTRYKSFSQFLK